tara:strand:+ start:202 stop:708 length:507 start_codon:yes stop_codon:yes gene_type:complete
MKKTIFALCLLPLTAFADNVSFIDIGFGEMGTGFETISGYSIALETVIDSSVALGISHLESSDDDWDIGISQIDINYALDSFNDGSFYVGASFIDSDEFEDNQDGFSIGYAKKSGEGLDYDIAAVVVNGVVGYGISLRSQIGENAGLRYGLSESNGISVVSLSLGVNF